MAYLIKLPTLELRTFIKSDKSIPIPKIVILDNKFKYGGMYCRRKKKELLFENLYIDQKDGIIVLPKNVLLAAFAHEYRHHWQHQRFNWKPSIWNNTKNYKAYKKAIIKYFTLSFFEMDALLFSLKYKPEHELLWYDWLIKNDVIKNNAYSVIKRSEV